MSSYRGEVGAWDGGPPGAEADYVPPPPAPAPTTDPWTGVSYSQYGQPNYDYQGYAAPAYGYTYDSTYYQRPDGGYYDSSSSAYPPQMQENYNYSRARDQTRSPAGSRGYDRRRLSYRSKSRSAQVCYNRRQQEYSKRDSSYEESRRRRSRSVSKTKYSKYSSSDRSSSKSRSYSRSPKRERQRQSSSESSRSDRSYKKSSTSRVDYSLTPPIKNRVSRSRNRSSSYEDRVKNVSPKYKHKTVSKIKTKTTLSNEFNLKDRRERDSFTPPRKNVSISPRDNKSDRSITPPIKYKRSEQSPDRKKKYKDKKTVASPRKPRDSSVTPPRCYARSRSGSSRSRSRSFTPKMKRKLSRTPKSDASRSSSTSHSSASSTRPRNKRRIRHKSASKHRSRSKSSSRERCSISKRRSSSRRRSVSRYKGRRSKSPKNLKSRSSRSVSRNRSCSGSPSDDECRGQFTVADRKRFWKMHRSRQEQAEKSRTPPTEIKPPPGAVESTHVDDIQYGVPPEVEGPNFAELLPTAEQVLQAPSSSKSKAVPIPIKNDGSFLEMFKKMQEETKKVEEAEKKPQIKKPVLPFIGKRRGGRVLKTGLVKKAKAIDEQTVDNTPKDAWSLYMQEVKKYRETSCEEERKTRPLVK